MLLQPVYMYIGAASNAAVGDSYVVVVVAVEDNRHYCLCIG